MTLAEPLVAELPRRPGQKEVRYAHLLSGEPVETLEIPSVDEEPVEPAEPARLDALEQAVDALRTEMAELRTRFEEFKREFQ